MRWVGTQGGTVVAAIEYIDNHANEDMRVQNGADSIRVGRRTLERKFSELVGRSVLSEIQHVHVQSAKRLFDYLLMR